MFEYCRSFKDIYYFGVPEQWAKIIGLEENEELKNISIHFRVLQPSVDNNVELEYFDDCFATPVNAVIKPKEINSAEQNFYAYEGLYLLCAYDISMKAGTGDSEQYENPVNGTVTIKIKLPDTGINEKRIKVLHYPKDGSDRDVISGDRIKIENGYIVFEVSHFSYFYICVETETPTIKICNNPGTATINYGDMLWLTAEATNLPEGAQVWWFFDSGFGASGNSIGTTVYRDSVVTVKILDSEGNVLKDADGNEITDTQNIICKSNIWLRIISFFKNLFRIERTIIQNL